MKGTGDAPNQTKRTRTSLRFNPECAHVCATITMKNIFKHWHLPRYLASIFTSRSVLISLCIFLGGILGLEFFNDIELELYKSFGPAIFPMMNLPDAVIVLAVIGGLIGFWTSQIIAAKRWQPDDGKILATKFPDKLPAGTQWHQITMKFLNDEIVFIIVREFKRQANYVEMGFADKRGKKHLPNKQWELLRLFAKKSDVMNLTDKEFDFANKKRKQMLAETLQAYFGLEDDPFYPYENEDAYRIRMTLYPPPEKVSGTKPSFMDFATNIREAQEEEAELG
jgi:hypothetical protein